jgi:alpha-beta hydrolase superfamily lysophospholipase
MDTGPRQPSTVAVWSDQAPTYEAVAFQADGVTLRGRLYRGGSPERPAPGLVMSPGFATTVSGMAADRYAEAFAAAGLIVLLYDHFGFGESDGEPRHEVEVWRQARSYVAAVSYLSSVPEVDADRLAIWGVSLSGRLALAVAAVDERVAALVVQVPNWGDEGDDIAADDDAFDTLREALLHADLDRYERTITGPLPVASPDQSSMPSLLIPITAFRWFMEYGAVFGTGWVNQATWVSIDTPVPLDARLCAPRVGVPTLAVTARKDEMPQCDADAARSLLTRFRGPKESLILDGGHFGALYPDTEEFRLAVGAETSFLMRHLARKT